MSYNASLKFNGGEAHKVLNVNYNVARAVDHSGRVASGPSDALIKVTIEATDKTEILESLLNGKFKPTKGEISFNKSHEEGTQVTLNWSNGYVIHHEVNFDAVNAKSMVINFLVSAETISYGGAEYNGAWPTA